MPKPPPTARPLDDEMLAYDANDLERLFGIPVSTVKALARAGHILPVRRGRAVLYSFQDLVVLRTIGELRAAKIPTRAINRTLRKLRSELPAAHSMSQFALGALGEHIKVREGQSSWDADSGQYALALEITSSVNVKPLNTLKSSRKSTETAHLLFIQGLDLEDTDAGAARTAYRSCLAIDPLHGEARINLGRLLHLDGALREAEQVYADSVDPSALLFFNKGVLLEDLDNGPEATQAYRDAIALDSAFADAHFNLARLYDRSGDTRASFRHLLAYRRLALQNDA